MVAVAGGLQSNSKGMELWNPMDDTLEIVSDVLPPEEGRATGLHNAQMVSYILSKTDPMKNKIIINVVNCIWVYLQQFLSRHLLYFSLKTDLINTANTHIVKIRIFSKSYQHLQVLQKTWIYLKSSIWFHSSILSM